MSTLQNIVDHALIGSLAGWLVIQTIRLTLLQKMVSSLRVKVSLLECYLVANKKMEIKDDIMA